MPTDDRIRLDDHQRIASLGKQSIEANKYQPIKDTKGLPSRSGAPQNVDLLPKHPDLCLQCCSRSHQVDERPENQPAKISHHSVASADSPLLANWIKFTIGTGDFFDDRELLSGVTGPHRHDEAATHFKLLNQRRRYLPKRGGHDDGVKRTAFGPAAIAVAKPNAHIVIREVSECFRGGLGQGPDNLDWADLSHQVR